MNVLKCTRQCISLWVWLVQLNYVTACESKLGNSVGVGIYNIYHLFVVIYFWLLVRCRDYAAGPC